MKFLADENLDAVIVRWLREQNTDVIYAAESAQAEADNVLLQNANNQKRIIITGGPRFWRTDISPAPQQRRNYPFKISQP